MFWSEKYSQKIELETFTIDELLPPGRFGVREAARDVSLPRVGLRKSLLDFPIEVHLFVVNI